MAKGVRKLRSSDMLRQAVRKACATAGTGCTLTGLLVGVAQAVEAVLELSALE